jgi:sigma-B regulation protein RsbU (phosphoserine phosphatase)
MPCVVLVTLISNRRLTVNKTLWDDTNALARLARFECMTERVTREARPVRIPKTRSAYPAFPDHHEFSVHAVESPSRMVTGDSFDYFMVSDEILAVVMADVSGKGLAAAVMVDVTRSLLRHLSAVSSSPADTVSKVNNILYKARLGSMYVTIFLGWYHVKTGKMDYSNCGHPQPFKIGADGSVSRFGEVTDPILGILDVEMDGQQSGELNVGEKLVLYTDGVTEACNPQGEFLGSDRLAGLLSDASSSHPDRLCREVADYVDEFQTNKRYDDATLMALERVA